MNQQKFEAGIAAYQNGDWAGAVAQLSEAQAPGEHDGRIDHLLGNALMKLGRYSDAADAYAGAMSDVTYGKVGALGTNRGRALLAAGRPADAVEALTAATQDATYKTPYKSFMALGSAYGALGDIRNAGIAYRNAAIDEANPDPSTALRRLGGCFMDLGRPVDAVEAYRTALDFAQPLQSQNAIYCDLALAYAAANRMSEAVDAFDHATADGTFTLAPEAQATYDAARNAVAARSAKDRSSETDDLLAAAGYGPMGYDHLDPTGATSDDLMPSPEDTGFFSVTEAELMANDKKDRKIRRKHRHTGRKVFLTILVILIILAGACGFAYYRGYGWPTQEAVIQNMFQAKTEQGDVEQYIDSTLSSDEVQQIVALINTGSTPQITSIERSMEQSTAAVTATLTDGSTKAYTVTFVRDGISWKVSSMHIETSSSAASTSSSSASVTTGTVETDATTASDDSSEEAEADSDQTEATSEDSTVDDASTEE